MANTKGPDLGYVAGESTALIGVVIALAYQVPDRSKFQKEIEKLEQYMRANIEAMPVDEAYVLGIENVFSRLRHALNKGTRK